MSMSVDPTGHAHEAAHRDEEPHGLRKDYLVGFVLAVILTAIPFWLVLARPLASQPTALIIMALLFTVVLVLIALSGSLGVMYHMNANMMPGMDMGSTG